MRKILVRAEWDDQAKIWIATSDNAAGHAGSRDHDARLAASP
ncbi:DUF1902 domain-containing protein [Methylococcus capsulatus]|nr:DUF1902 domain-containing protein [Methylococcus capsulatus]